MATAGSGATMRGGMLLVAGYPGTGKSVLAAAVERRIPGIRAIAFDDAKLARYERAGFADPEERARLDALALDDFLADVDAAMAEGATIAIDYPFSEKQRPRLAALCERHRYAPCTVRLVADFDVLFERQRARDLDPSRHPALILDAYEPGMRVDAATREAAALTRVEFRRRYDERGYGAFALGDALEIDTTDFQTVDVEAIADWVEARLGAATSPASAERGTA